MSELEMESIDVKELEMFGLSNYEARAYLHLLPMGLTTAKHLSSLSSIPGGRIYEVLTTLEQKGLVQKQDSRPKRYLAIEPSHALRSLLEMKNEELEIIKQSASSVEEKLSSIYNSPVSESLFWSVAMEGEMMERLAQKFAETEKELLLFNNLDPMDVRTSKEALKANIDVLELLKERKVDIKMIIGGITEEQFKEVYLPAMLPYFDIIKDIPARITLRKTNAFDVIDQEKVVIKIPNPVEPTEYIALIYLWQKNFAEKMRKKFFVLWETSKELKIKVDLE